MKRIAAILLTMALLLAGCQSQKQEAAEPAEETVQPTETETSEASQESEAPAAKEPVVRKETPTADVTIVLADDGVTVDGQAASEDPAQAVYVAKDIVYYPTGQDFTFGEGTEADAHEASEADGHTVVHITQPGVYEISGTLTAGQIAVDLGEDVEEDPDAVVTLVLNGADITCTVAPAVIFYHVYECGTTDEASETVDTSAAGANVFLADGSENNVRGSYVARIYKPDTVELSEDGTEVADAKKLHKYDAAFYSKMTINIDGNDGILNIDAENEGLDSELHLTINGGEINIESGNDGINTNEDGVSVTTINGGSLTITVTGETGEGDGIDSNGWLVINGGTVTASACGFSGDAGIDSDMGIYIHGGTVRASGNMLDRIAGGEQTYAVFTFGASQKGGAVYTLKNADGESVIDAEPANDFSILILAGDLLEPGDYTFWCDDAQLAAAAGQGFGGMGGMMMPTGEMPEMPEGMEQPEGMEIPEMPENGEMTPPEGMEWPENMEIPENGDDMTPPAGMERPEGIELPEGMEQPELPEGMELPEGAEMPQGGRGFGGNRGQMAQSGEVSATFTIVAGENYFSAVTLAQ